VSDWSFEIPGRAGPLSTIAAFFSPALHMLRGCAMAILTPDGLVRRDSYIRVRARVMLVRIERGDEPCDLGLDVEVLRVRHPLPACERMRVTRPAVVILSPDVRAWDVVHVEQTAQEVGAAIIQLGPLVARDALAEWLREVLSESASRRPPPEVPARASPSSAAPSHRRTAR